MKIYTKGGDRGTTSTFAGGRVGKDSARVAACGDVDELNSLLGVIVAGLTVVLNVNEGSKRIDSSPWAQNDRRMLVVNLTRIQNELFVLQSDLAAPYDMKLKIPRVVKVFITRLEREIDVWEKSLPTLKNFILPGGGEIGANLHLARTVARRTERSIASLSREEKINQHALAYINRLSDWFFVLARYVNKIENQPETIWRGRSK